jgi:type VI secretion system secreted protein VgrG
VSDYQKSLDYVLKNEGGFVNDPDDSGGATNMGITQHTLSLYKGLSASIEDVKNLTREDVSNIYYMYYWSPMCLTFIENDNIATALFDFGVNSGNITSIKLTQTVLNKIFTQLVLKADGHLGPETMDALNKVDPINFIHWFISGMLNYYHSLVQRSPKDAKFLNGWVNRSQKLLTLI